MNILNKFTIRSLILNKKRTIVTIIGIMLSSALICGLVGLVSSFQQSFINMVKDSTGNYDIRFYDVPTEDAQEIKQNKDIAQTFYTHEIGIAKLEGSMNVDKPYISIMEYDKLAFSNNGVKLLEGRLPRNDEELLISQHINTNGRLNYKVGDKLVFEIGKRVTDDGFVLNQDNPYMSLDENNPESYNEKIIDAETKMYTVVGIIRRPDYTVEKFSSPAYTAITCMEKLPSSVDVSILSKNPKQYKEISKVIVESDNIENGKYKTYINNELLRYKGVMSNNALSTLYGIAAVVMCIIIFSSVFVIRNSFSISVSEKNKQYGMLSSVGATKRQIRKSVVFEGLIIGLIAVPLGILCGVIGIVVLLKVVNYLLADSLMGMSFVYSLPAIPILISVAISFLTIYLSSMLPAIKASKISPIDAIRGNKDIKIKSKKIKTPKYIKKLFGIGGVISSKNLKRCRRKYTTTVISIVISIVIFVSLSSFMHYGNATSDLYYTELKCNMSVRANKKDVNLYKDIIELNKLQDYAYYYQTSAMIDEKHCTDFGKEMFEIYEEEPRIGGVLVCNNEYYKKYIKALGISESEYDKGAILIDDVVVNETDGGKVEKHMYNIKDGEIASIKLGDKTEVKIFEKTNVRPMGYEKTYTNGGNLVVSEDYIGDVSELYLDNLYINAKDATTLENSINDLIKDDAIKYGGLKVTNYETLVAMQNRMVLVIAIFLYGFITVITLIGVTNIFNTISTNMLLRSKEFAMLKSVGMTTKEFNKMIRLESILYGTKALLIGIPIGILGSYMIYLSFAESLDTGYTLPLNAIIISIVFVFIIVGITMKYSLNRINKQNIIETIRNDNI